MTIKRTLIILAAICGGLILLLVVAVALFYKVVVSPREPPPELREARVVTGADFLKKSEFYSAGKGVSWGDMLDPEKATTGWEQLRAVAVGQLDGKEGTDVGVAGQFGLTVLDTRGEFRERVNFKFETGKMKIGPVELGRTKDSFYEMRVLDVEGDGVCEVLGYSWRDGMALFDHQGRLRFGRGEEQEGKSSIQAVAAGDVDGDGSLEFVASWGYDPWVGLELLDQFGKSRWRREERGVLRNFELADVDGDGRAEMVAADGEDLVVRDVRGEVLSRAKAPVYLWHVAALPRPEGHGPPQNLAVREGSTWLMDLDGKTFKKFDAPLSHIKLDKPRGPTLPGTVISGGYDSEEIYEARGAWLRLKKDGPKLLVVLARFAALGRSLVYVYDEQGRLVYHELLPEACAGLAALPPAAEGGAEEFLVGCEKTVWRYAAP